MRLEQVRRIRGVLKCRAQRNQCVPIWRDIKEGVIVETLCISCINSTNECLCCWAGGEERTDWQVKHERGGITVTACPDYKQDYKLLTIADICKIIGRAKNTVVCYPDCKIKDRLKAKGYNVKILQEKGENRTVFQIFEYPPSGKNGGK